MRIVVVYESMFGNTHDLADAIAMALAPAHEVTTVPVGSANPHTLDGADLVLVGGPTHAHGESWPKTRAAARQQAERDHLTLDPDAGADRGCASGSTASGTTSRWRRPSTPGSTHGRCSLAGRPRALIGPFATTDSESSLTR